MTKRSVRRVLSRCIAISSSATLATLGVVALRHALNTPQPLKSSLPGEALLYSWRRRSVFYKVLGDANAPPLVLLHAPGIGASARKMQLLMEPLAQTYRVYAPDLPGFGLSDRSGIDYSTTLYTEFCQDFLRDVVREPATLVAHKLSCNYAVVAAANTPELCSALVLISPLALQGAKQPGWLQSSVEHPMLKALLYPLLSTRLAFQLMRRDQQSKQADFSCFYATTHQLGAEHAPMALLAGKLREDTMRQFGTLRQQILLIWGTRALEDQRNLAALRSSTQGTQTRVVELISGAGLEVQEEQADRVAATIQRWQTETVNVPKELMESNAQAISSILYEDRAEEALLSSAIPVSLETSSRSSEEVSEELADFIELEPLSTAQEEEEEEEAASAHILAYCVKCRKKTEMLNVNEFVMRNGRPAVRGVCSNCGSNITRIGKLS